MLMYTDGGDTTGALGRGELQDLLRASDVTVYAIGELEHQPQSIRMQQRMILQQIAEATGGQAFFPTAVKELDSVHAKVVPAICGRGREKGILRCRRSSGWWLVAGDWWLVAGEASAHGSRYARRARISRACSAEKFSTPAPARGTNFGSQCARMTPSAECAFNGNSR